MHCSVHGKNVTHIQRAQTELCCIMLDNIDHSVFWGLFLMVCRQRCVQIAHYFYLVSPFPRADSG